MAFDFLVRTLDRPIALEDPLADYLELARRHHRDLVVPPQGAPKGLQIGGRQPEPPEAFRSRILERAGGEAVGMKIDADGADGLSSKLEGVET